MKTVKTKGIIIAEKVMSDFDKMLTILTPNMGKIECVAKGSRRPKSLLMAGTQFLCFGDYMLYKGGENYSMNSCETIELFYNIRTDLDKLKYAVYILSNKTCLPGVSKYDLKDRTIHRMLQTSITGNHLKYSYHKYSKRQELQDKK